jgi:predicted Na+-dependent transporter
MTSQNERLIGSAFLAFGIFIGLNLHLAADALAPLALPALFLVAMSSLVSLANFDLVQIFRISPVMWRIVIWQQFFVPVLVLFLGRLFQIDEEILLFVLITATAGSLFATPAIVGLLQLDHLKAVQGVVLSTLFTPMSLYIFLTIKQGEHTDIDFVLFLERICVFLIIPALFLYAYKVATRRMRTTLRSKIELVSRWLSIIALIIFGIAVMDPVNKQLYHNPSQVLFYLTVATFAGLTMYGLTAWMFRKSSILESRTAAILTGFRNIGLSYGLVGDMIGDDFAIYVGIAMVPTFVVPFLLNIVSNWAGDKAAINRKASGA